MRQTIHHSRFAVFTTALIIVLSFCFFSTTHAQIPDWSWATNGTGSSEDAALGVAADASGNSFAVGYFQSSTITFGTTTLTRLGGVDVFTVKYDGNGNVLWAQGGAGDGTDKAYAVATDGSGNVYVTGAFNSSSITFGSTILTNGGGDDLFLVKYDASGNLVWAKKATGSGNDQGRALATDGSGNVYLGGYFQSASFTFGTTTLFNSSAGGSTDDLFVLKLDGDGNVLWGKSAGLSVEGDYVYSIATYSGNVYVAGVFASSSITFGTTTLTNTSATGTNDAFLVKYDGSGNVLWAISDGGTGQDYFQSISTDGSGNVYATGYFRSATATFGTVTLTNVGEQDHLLVKYDDSGNVVWATSAGGTGDDLSYAAAVDGSGNCYVAGYYISSSITFGSFTLNNVSSGTYDIYLVKYDGSGNVLWAQTMGGLSHDQAFSADADASGNVWIAGTFASSSLSFGSVTINNTSGDFDTYNAKIGAVGCSLNVTASANPICKGKKATLSVTGGTTYTWSPATGLNSTTGSSVIAKPPSTTTYTVTADGGACSSTVTLTVNPAPKVMVSQSPCTNHKVKLTASSNPASGVAYQWLKNNTLIAGATNKVYAATATASYSCRVTIIATGCNKTSAAVSVTITCRMSDEEVSVFDATAYPNPFEKSVTVSIATRSDEPATVTLLDLSGRIIRQYNNIDVSQPFEINETLSPGVYIVNVKQGENEKMIKVIKND